MAHPAESLRRRGVKPLGSEGGLLVSLLLGHGREQTFLIAESDLECIEDMVTAIGFHLNLWSRPGPGSLVKNMIEVHLHQNPGNACRHARSTSELNGVLFLDSVIDRHLATRPHRTIPTLFPANEDIELGEGQILTDPPGNDTKPIH
ncbi:hypothetical protein BCR44DRAFT_68805 [Catenaria anguillulae PL171]|uniref:Uncharacterized protein n=1 Tax=Catenaria anguillulae PL171 TaxID=765915 RepID=A0A1Y2H423_9FUNG|nr:hypothetical protein BCR44DRAFT_68805 [Catenaria anguillulae PL171]